MILSLSVLIANKSGNNIYTYWSELLSLDFVQWLRVAVSKGSTRLGAFLYLKKEAELASET